MNTITEVFYSPFEVFQALGGLQDEYNWLITDTDFYFEEFSETIGNYRIKNSDDDILEIYWIPHKNISKFTEHEYFGLSWGVFSAFPKNEKIELSNLEIIPFADGNPSFWVPNPKTQHPKALFEIVFWDSSYNLLISKDENISSIFRNAFEGWKDLNLYNEEI
ncbi:hypothetical protein ACFVR2_06040 [Gottfriedia sp. NPDC057991]|uniref:hypothetical protein n=1 Tax=Gottfriedia sp. NPDC057991 TaxID=3346298 RepID=UPI0036D98662